MRKRIIIIASLIMLLFTGCGKWKLNGAWWEADVYKYNKHEYLVFTNNGGGIAVVEVTND